MTTLTRRVSSVTGAVAVVAATLLAGAVAPATAATAPNPCPSTPTTCPDFEPDNANEFGTVTFYDANGFRVTGGSTTDRPSAAYAVASTDDPVASNYKATLYGYAAKGPKPASPGNFSGEAFSAATNFPVTATGTPMNIASLGQHRPVVSLAQKVTSAQVPAQTESIADLAAHFPNSTDANYANIYQFRIQTYSNTQYWAADILIDPTAKTWQQIYPEAPQKSPTTVSLSASQPSSYAGQSVTFTATVTPSAAAGTVQFTVDGANTGAPVAVSGGQAQYTTSSLRSGGGNRSIGASFVPTDATTYNGSSAEPLSYTVKGKPFISSVAVSGTPRVDQTLTCLSSSDDPNARVSYRWFRNSAFVAAGQTYGLTANDYNTVVFCTADYVNGAGSSTAESNQVGVGAGPNLRVVRLPRFRAALVSGKRAYVLNGAYSPVATSYAYQWSINGRAVKGATRSFFTVPKKARGKLVSVRVTARRYGYGDAVVVLKAKVRK